MTLTEHFRSESELVFWSFRYFLGRRTSSTCDFAERLARAWPLIDEEHRRLIQRELEEAFERDYEDRADGKQIKWLGDDCDRAAWEKVRKAYQLHEHHQK